MADSETEVQVAPATMADLDPLADQWVDLARDQRTYDSRLAAADNRAAIREILAGRVVADEVRVARDDDERLGFVTFGIERGQYEQTLTRGIVHNLFVVPAARNRGVGAALLDAAERRLADAGAEAVALEVMAGNADAHRFYERRGYEPHRVELERRLGADDASDGDATDAADSGSPKSDTHSREGG